MGHNRRRLLGKALLVLCWFFGSLTAIYMVGGALRQPPFWAEIPQPVRVLGVLLGIAITALNVGWIVLFVREVVRGEGSQYLLSRTDEGTARISLRAIRSSLFRRVREIEDVISAKLAVRRPASNRVRVEVSYTTTEDRNAIVLSESIRKVLRSRFEELVHSDDEFEIEFDVKIDGFVPGGAKQEEPEKAEEAEPFTGPRYPID
jgi:hypothetical protein